MKDRRFVKAAFLAAVAVALLALPVAARHHGPHGKKGGPCWGPANPPPPPPCAKAGPWLRTPPRPDRPMPRPWGRYWNRGCCPSRPCCKRPGGFAWGRGFLRRPSVPPWAGRRLHARRFGGPFRRWGPPRPWLRHKRAPWARPFGRRLPPWAGRGPQALRRGGAPFVCPHCGKPIRPVPPKAERPKPPRRSEKAGKPEGRRGSPPPPKRPGPPRAEGRRGSPHGPPPYFRGRPGYGRGGPPRSGFGVGPRGRYRPGGPPRPEEHPPKKDNPPKKDKPRDRPALEGKKR